jgi:hypothetical protein
MLINVGGSSILFILIISLDLWNFQLWCSHQKPIEAYFGVKQSPVPCTLHTTKYNKIDEILLYLANTQCPK